MASKSKSVGVSILSEAISVSLTTILICWVRFSGQIPSVNFKAYLV